MATRLATAGMGTLLTAFALGALGPVVTQAQDSGTHRVATQAQKDSTDVQREAAKEGQENDRINNDPSLNNDGSPRKDSGHTASASATDLHRTHPNAAARCHDGFFTTTRDRSRACSRHGGIDVWING